MRNILRGQKFILTILAIVFLVVLLFSAGKNVPPAYGETVKVDIYYSYGGCGSGTSSPYGYTRTPPGGSHNGTMQPSCSNPDPQGAVRAAAIAYANTTPYEEVWVNGVKIQDPAPVPVCTTPDPAYVPPVRVDINYSYSGRCGSGTSNSYGYKRTPPGESSRRNGNTQISCSVSDPEGTLRAQAIAYAGISPAEDVWINATEHYQPSNLPAAVPTTCAVPPAANCTPKAGGKKVEITYMKYSSTGGRCGLSWTGVGFQYSYYRTPDKGACINGRCVDSIKVECNLDQAVGDKQIRDAAIAFAKVQPGEEVYINGTLTCDIAPAPTLTPPGPPCAQWQKPGPESGVCLKVATSLFQGKNGASGDISTDPSQFIINIFTIILSFAGGIALLLIISAGYKILTSKGKPEGIQQGRDQLISAIVGLLFIIFSIVIFQLIVADILKIPGIK